MNLDQNLGVSEEQASTMTNTTKADQTQEQKPLISEAESRQRADAVDFARA